MSGETSPPKKGTEWTLGRADLIQHWPHHARSLQSVNMIVACAVAEQFAVNLVQLKANAQAVDLDEPDEECKEIHHVWVKGSAENTWYPVYASSKEEVATQVHENISKERSLERHLSLRASQTWTVLCAMSGDSSVRERDNTFHCLEGSEICDVSNTLSETKHYKSELLFREELDSGSFVVRGWCDEKLVELTAFVADYTQARKKQLDFLESMQVYEEVYVDDLPSGTRVMSGQDERDPCLFVNAELDICRCAVHYIVNFFAVKWGQASDWREAWNREWLEYGINLRFTSLKGPQWYDPTMQSSM